MENFRDDTDLWVAIIKGAGPVRNKDVDVVPILLKL
jgi:hypothetical protein